MLKLAHFADLHASEKTQDEVLNALKSIFDRCRGGEVNAILNCGDTFDGPVTLGHKGPINDLLQEMAKAPGPLYFIEGTKSHDIPGSIDIFDHLKWGFLQVYVHNKPDSYQIVKHPDIADLRGSIHPAWNLDPGDAEPCGHMSFLPALSKSYLARDITASPEEMNQIIQEKLRGILAGFGAKAAESPRPHILMGHFTVSGSETSTGQVILGGDIQLSVADLNLANADYVALGHIHKAQQPQLPPHIHYAGSPYHLNFGELEDKGFKIVTFDDDGNLAGVEFVKTPSRPRQVIDLYVKDGKLNWPEGSGLYLESDIRVRIYGPQHEITDEIVKEVEEFCEEAHSVKVEIIPTAENRIRAAELTSAETLREKLQEYAKVKDIEIPETALVKADRLEEAIA